MGKLSDFSPAERLELLKELKAQAETEKQLQREERAAYDKLKDEAISVAFDRLLTVSNILAGEKKRVFETFENILALKKQVFIIDDERFETQQSHTFTTLDGGKSITLGSNTVDRWDETVDVGVSRIKAYLAKLAKDDESAFLVSMITDLLKPNKDGALKASRVLDLSKKAAELGDAELMDAVNIIRDAYRPFKTSLYIKAKFKNGLGTDEWLALSMSQA